MNCKDTNKKKHMKIFFTSPKEALPDTLFLFNIIIKIDPKMSHINA